MDKCSVNNQRVEILCDRYDSTRISALEFLSVITHIFQKRKRKNGEEEEDPEDWEEEDSTNDDEVLLQSGELEDADQTDNAEE